MREQPQNDQEIRQMLMQLHDELERAQALDENDRALMRHLMNDIQDMLDQPAKKGGAAYQPSSTVISRMEKAVSRLEVSHPTLTMLIEKTMESLNIAGI